MWCGSHRQIDRKALSPLCRGVRRCYNFIMRNAFAAPAVGSLVAFRTAPADPIGRIVAIRDIRGDGSLMAYTLDTIQPATNLPIEAYGHAILVVAEAS
jgi:hypothetical protein